GAQSRLANLAGQFGVNIPSGESGQSPQFYADLIRSREILGSVADTTFQVADTAGLFSRGMLRGPVSDLMELAEDASPPGRRAAVINWLRDEAISVSTGTETGVVELSITTPWPELSAGIAGQIVDLVNEFNLETRQSQAASERRFIEGRVEQAQHDLREVENALQTFLQNNRQFQNSPELTFEHDRLQRQVSMQQQVYTSLVQAREQARIDEVRNTPVITVVEPAEEPVRPDSRQLPLKAALGIVLGGMLGSFVGFGREYARRQREEDADDFKEFSVLWEETKGDLTGMVGRFRKR
ncbi:MAG: GNVR domain-containing protein, partial [Gemmatimonadota bacterium]